MTEQINQITPAVSEIVGLQSFDSLLSIAVRETASRKQKAETVLSAVSIYEKISVSASVIKSVLGSYLREIEEKGFPVPSWHGRILLSEIKYDVAKFADIIKEPEKPTQPENPAANDESATNEYNRLMSDYNKESALYAATMEERKRFVFRDEKNNRVFLMSENPLKEGVNPVNIKVYLFSSMRLDKGRFSEDMLSGDKGISNASELLRAVGISAYIDEVGLKSGLTAYVLSDEEKRYIASYVGVSLSERGDYLLLKAHSEGVRLSDEEYEKQIKTVAKSIFAHLKEDGLTDSKKDRVIPAVSMELRRIY